MDGKFSLFFLYYVDFLQIMYYMYNDGKTARIKKKTNMLNNYKIRLEGIY